MFNKEKIKYFKKTLIYLKRYRGLAFSVIVFSFLSSIFEGFGISTFIPVFQVLSGSDIKIDMPYFDTLKSVFTSHNQGYFVVLFFLFILLMVILKNIFNYLNSITVNKVSNFIKRDLRTDLFSHLVDSSLKFFNGVRSGHLIGSISIYTESVSGFIFSFLSLAIIFCRSTIYLLLLLALSWKFTLLLLAFGLAFFPLARWVLVKIRRVSLKIADHVSTLHFQMSEMFNNIYLMKIFSTEDYEKKRFNQTTNELAWNYYRGAKYSNLLVPIFESLIMVLLLSLLMVILFFSKSDYGLYLPSTIVYLYVFSRFYIQINDFTRLLSGMYSQIEPFRLYEDLLKQAKNEAVQNGNVQIKEFKNKIEFKDVNFGYNVDQLILENINLEIEQGKFVAVVGPTGVGKTTIANLVAGLYLPNSGQILIDGVDLNTINLGVWRKKIGYVSQEIMVFNDTVRHNIKYGADGVDDAKMEEATKAVGLHDFIVSLPQGYNTILGEHGAKLSGGQKQRLSIARAILHNPEILILDEATSSLDLQTEVFVQESLHRFFGKCTIIAIAHRLSTIAKADKIFVLHAGHIIEEGKHKDLMASGGFYSLLYNLQ